MLPRRRIRKPARPALRPRNRVPLGRISVRQSRFGRKRGVPGLSVPKGVSHGRRSLHRRSGDRKHRASGVSSRKRVSLGNQNIRFRVVRRRKPDLPPVLIHAQMSVGRQCMRKRGTAPGEPLFLTQKRVPMRRDRLRLGRVHRQVGLSNLHARKRLSMGRFSVSQCGVHRPVGMLEISLRTRLSSGRGRNV
jgi:hypothetical protein